MPSIPLDSGTPSTYLDHMSTHTLTVFNAVDLPDSVSEQVMSLLASYSPDIYTRECDADGRC